MKADNIKFPEHFQITSQFLLWVYVYYTHIQTDWPISNILVHG